MRYMPVLRVQQSEYLALGALAQDVADDLVPLLYQTRAYDPDAEDVAERRLRYLSRQWDRPAFFDPEFALVHDDLDAPFLYNIASELGPYAPAVPLHQRLAVAASPAAENHGCAALRVTDPYAVLDPGLPLQQEVDQCVDGLGLDPASVTLGL